MKKIIITLLFSVFAAHLGLSQNWATSFKFAKRLALLENKMILAIWEDSAYEDYLVLVEDENGIKYDVKLFEDEKVNKLVWDYFVPVIINEYNYQDLANALLENRSSQYKDRFNDDYLKVMDPNGNILNTSFQGEYGLLNLSELIRNYALNVSFLKPELTHYFENKSFSSAFRLAVKYLDFATYANPKIKKELVGLFDIYMQEAKTMFNDSDFDNKEALSQKMELLDLNKQLILGRHRKVYKALKNRDESTIDDINKPLFAFLKYTSLRGVNKVEESLQWKDKVSQTDLNKVKFIVK